MKRAKPILAQSAHSNVTHGVGGGAAASVARAAKTLKKTLLAQAAKLRQAWREARGASQFMAQDAGLRFESAGGAAPSARLVDGPRRAPGARSASQQLVTEMMILANEAAATLGTGLLNPKTLVPTRSLQPGFGKLLVAMSSTAKVGVPEAGATPGCGVFLPRHISLDAEFSR